MATYVLPARLHPRDNDLFYWDAYAWTALSAVSDIVDLGAVQKFTQIPVSIHWEFSADFSLPSAFAATAPWQGLEIQDAADGSTFITVAVIPLHSGGAVPHTGASTVSSSTVNARDIGLVSIRRYSRLAINYATATPSLTVKAWLRLGLTD